MRRCVRALAVRRPRRSPLAGAGRRQGVGEGELRHRHAWRARFAGGFHPHALCQSRCAERRPAGVGCSRHLRQPQSHDRQGRGRGPADQGLQLRARPTVESLMARGDDEPFTLYGLLARSVETDDARSYVTFHLDPRARFSDGQPVTADDVLFSWELLRDHGRPNSPPVLFQGHQAEALDPAHGAVRSRRRQRSRTAADPRPDAGIAAGMRPMSASFEETSMSPPVGSGPYRVSAVNPGASVTFTRNPDYWGRDLPINRGILEFRRDQVRFLSRGERRMFEAFKRGLYDFRVETEPLRWHDGYDFPAASDGEVIRDTIKTGMPQPSEFLVFNTRRPIFSDMRVRQALDAAVRFRMDQPQLLLRAVWPLGRLLRRVRIVGLWPARRRPRARAAETVRVADTA